MSGSKYLETIQKAMSDRDRTLPERESSRNQNPITNQEDPNLPLEPPPAAEQTVQSELDIISRDSIHTELSKAVSNVFYGINMLGYRAPVPINKDQYGLTLFTKPRMRLTRDNLLVDRKLSMLDVNDSTSYASAVRAYLDPVSHRFGDFKSIGVDPKNCFIPLLTNTVETATGWPDIVIDTYNSPEGVRKETWMMYDGVVNINSRFSITCAFKNMTGDPISFLFDSWLRYGSLVREGEIMPYYSNIFYREIDYQTAIWRLVLNADRTHVTKIAKTYAAMPQNLSIGQSFNFNGAAPFNQENASINIQFECVGVDYNDPILIDEFNTIVSRFNPGMNDLNRERMYKKLPHGLTNLFNYRTYMRINPVTNELEQWTDYESYYQILGED